MVLIDWIRVTGLSNPQRRSFDNILEEFAFDVIGYSRENGNPFSWPTHAGTLGNSPAIRTLRPTVAAVKLGINMEEWTGTPPMDMLSKTEKEGLEVSETTNNRTTSGSIKRKRTLNDFVVDPKMKKLTESEPSAVTTSK
ncbi:hypothetical protein Q1695_003279 [Nippostrongylus brasiliensis]|nr:hypothetical protein Q1695_003279 [Nippostrongylus brasiliensis]